MAIQSKGPAVGKVPAKTYRKPTLIKGPKLTGVTALSPVSGVADCWVARAAFGPADFRWMIFRAWLLDDAPAWLRTGYIRHGQGVAERLARSDAARRCVRWLMLKAIQSKLAR